LISAARALWALVTVRCRILAEGQALPVFELIELEERQWAEFMAGLWW
jgi:hypothetical protein